MARLVHVLLIAPTAVLGFGAYVAVEHFADGGRRVVLNPAPFAPGAPTVVDASRVVAVEPLCRRFRAAAATKAAIPPFMSAAPRP